MQLLWKDGSSSLPSMGALPLQTRRRRRRRPREGEEGPPQDDAGLGSAAGARRRLAVSMRPGLLMLLLLAAAAAVHACQAFQLPARGVGGPLRSSSTARAPQHPRCRPGHRPLYSVEEQGPRTARVADSGGDGGAAIGEAQQQPQGTAGPWTPELEALLARRLQYVVEQTDDVDRAALYLARRDPEAGLRGGLSLIPGVVLPPGDAEWMESRLAAVRQCAGEGGPSLLPSGELVLPIRYGRQAVAALLMEDTRQTKRRLKRKKQQQQLQQQEQGAAMALKPPPEPAEIFTEGRVGRIQEVADRVLGSALKDTLVSDASWSGPDSAPFRQEVVSVDGGAPVPLPFSMVTQQRLTRRQREKEAAEAEAAAERAAAANGNLTRPIALGVPVEELVAKETDPEASIVIPKEQVTTSVGGATNVTFDLHLLEDFKHLFDDVSLGSLDNNTNLVILKIAAPVVAALALEPLISLVDTYYVGQYLGPISLSAYGLSERVYVFSLYVLNFLATSTTPIVANLRAQGEEEAARELVGRLLFFGAMLGVVLIPILQTLSYPLLNLLGARPENYVEAVEYFQVRSWGTPAIMINAVSNGALRGYLNTAYPLIVAGIAFVVDYSVDPKIVYPQDPDGLGAAGAATVVAEWLSAGMFLSKFVFGMKPPIVPVVDLFPPWAEMAPVVKAGAQIFIRTVLYQGLLAASCATAARIGPIDIAAHQVALELWIPPSFLMDAFSIAAQGLVADALGRGDRAKARELSQLLIKWGVAMGGFLSLGVAAAELLYPEALPHFFTEDQGIVDKVENVLWVIAIMQPINGLVSVGAGVLQGAQDFSYQVITMTLSAIFAGSLFFLLRDEGLPAVWQTLLAFQVVRSVLFAYRFNEPLGPLSILPKRKKQKVLVGSAFSTNVFDHDKHLPKSKRKKKRPWFNRMDE